MPKRIASRPKRMLLSLVFLWVLISGCAGRAAGQLAAITGTPAAPTAAAVDTGSATAAPTGTAEAVEQRLWVSTGLPQAFRDQFKPPQGVQIAQAADQANLWLDVTAPGSGAKNTAAHAWIYVVAAAFPTLMDEIHAADLEAIWAGKGKTAGSGSATLVMTAETQAVLERAWGKASPRQIKIVEQAALLDTAWKDIVSPTPTAVTPTASKAATPTAAPVKPTTLAILPFEEIEPRWKVIRVDGQSPVEKGFQAGSYPLAIPIGIRANPQSKDGEAALRELPNGLSLPTNYDPAKLTVLVMTGTTAISRHIGERMEAKGMTYPDQDIRDWLADADLTHISNEVSFYQDCPKPGPQRADMRFCSSPKYIELLEDVHTDIIELTGNHNLDWGYQPFLDSLAMYRQRGWQTYGGGATLDEAKKTLLITHNGNRLAFLGCSPAGPQAVWATQYTPGSAPCNLDKMEEQIRRLRADGYLPIVTFQAVETDTYKPAPAQAMPDFRRMARAGAVIVSGSQSHVPQTMTIVNDHFVHYGLGNLFFDQMTPPESRQEFIDQHIFYDGKYLGVRLLTALLEDYARPRPMTQAERSDFLQKIFSLCNWNEN